MRTNATSGLVLSLYLSIVLFVILISVTDKAHAKRGCSAFGHSCFGGHGKRFDSTVRHNTLQESMSQNFQESEVPSPNDELFYVLPNDEFRERSDQSFMRTRKDTQQYDLYPLSSLVEQWIASHRRPHRTEADITNK
ncbi:neuropeptide CCHamide-2-like isoform X2 [Pogonomyrmex barbatus]|uniref:Neuropeptide CCHamide-2-like isoform X2 n=1 Tax=Pogonomyrmex barbatus TaxID=144034 RepID=A0A6I9WTW9_9HYME|nr:neuropeptide CCHamide-2-like isoform X2 [Pogonomyrmex barbatus]